MEWLPLLLLLVGSLFLLMFFKVPIAFCFLFLNIVFGFFLWNGGNGIQQVVLSMFDTVGSFVMSPLPLFVLLGEILFVADIAPRALYTVDKLMGRFPGRLALVGIVSGVFFAALTGSSSSSTAMLGTMLVPEMEKRGYSKVISFGAVMGSGGLAAIIPPSGGAILIGALANVSIGAVLISGIIPGIFMACIYALYNILRCKYQPNMAPNYEPEAQTSLIEKLSSIVTNVLPLIVVVFAIIGFMFLGIATPTEAAATGAIAAFILAIAYRKLNLDMVKRCTSGTLRISAMLFFIIGGAVAFSQILAFTGATQGFVNLISNIDLPPFGIVLMMMLIVLILGAFMDSTAILMIVIPIFMPIIRAIGYDPVVFCLLLLINIETGFLTPPFGIVLFAMKAISPPDTKTTDIYQAAIPYVACNVLAIVLIMVFPFIASWLPSIMKM